MMDIQYKRADGSFVAMVNGYPYHVTASDPLFQEAQAAGSDAPFDPEPEPESIESKRARATLTRANFCIALRQAGVMSAADAISAAKGDWPASFSAALVGMSQDEQDDAQILWAAATEVQRSHPLLAVLRASVNWTDAQLDVLFGIAE